MFLAFSAALRSADLSRQVGAVVTRVCLKIGQVYTIGPGLYRKIIYRFREADHATL
jgi:hypothetical protein